MRNFLTKTLLFIVIFILFLILIFFTNKYFSNVKIDDKKQILLVGHSHSECAFNDSIIKGLVNFSRSGESYFYTYTKIKFLIEENPRINKLLIEFSNSQIDKRMDDWIWGDNYMSDKFPKLAPFMDVESINLLIDKNPKGFKQNIFPMIKNNFKMTIKGFKYTNELGGYLYLEKNLSNALAENKLLTRGKEYINDMEEISLKNIEYLQKIIAYCGQNGIKVYFIRSPVHEEYPGFQNEEIFQNIRASNFPNVEFLDFTQFPISNEEFADLEHLNYLGANKFSQWFADLLNDGLFEKENKQGFIDGQIRAFVNN